jgi:hypothetical protein
MQQCSGEARAERGGKAAVSLGGNVAVASAIASDYAASLLSVQAIQAYHAGSDEKFGSGDQNCEQASDSAAIYCTVASDVYVVRIGMYVTS